MREFRATIINDLWQMHGKLSPQMQLIENALIQRGSTPIVIDHFAIIDLPSAHSGISILQKIFMALGFEPQGKDYLANKQNDFVWLAEKEKQKIPAREMLPQVVVADFRLDELPPEIRTIVMKYCQQINPFPEQFFANYINDSLHGNELALENLRRFLQIYFQGREWLAPTKKDYLQVKEFNELLAWVLVFGRRPNHFTLSIHLLNNFFSLEDFNVFIQQQLCLELNTEGGLIKGNRQSGIEQSSTVGRMHCVELADGIIQIPAEFVEFVWRFPKSHCEFPVFWDDFFTGFVADHANHVIESLYD